MTLNTTSVPPTFCLNLAVRSPQGASNLTLPSILQMFSPRGFPPPKGTSSISYHAANGRVTQDSSFLLMLYPNMATHPICYARLKNSLNLALLPSSRTKIESQPTISSSPPRRKTETSLKANQRGTASRGFTLKPGACVGWLAFLFFSVLVPWLLRLHLQDSDTSNTDLLGNVGCQMHEYV